MFSKIRKHLNIMCLLLILLIGILGIVLMGVYSIDDYCQDYIISKVEAQDKLIDNDINCIMSNAESMLATIEICLTSNSDILGILSKLKSNNFSQKDNSYISNVYVVDNNMLYNMKDNKSVNAKEAKETEWYQKTIDKKDIYVSNCFEDFSNGEKCIAICKKINSNKTVVAVCIRISNIINALKFEDIESAYIINQNNVIIASTSDAYINVNVNDDHKQLPDGHVDIFKNINIIDGTEEINTSGGRLLVSITKSNENIKCVVIRDKTILIQDINNKYLEILAMLVVAFLLVVGVCVVAAMYTRKVKEVNYSKCEFIEGMAAEIKIPLDSINYMGKMILKEVEDENIIQCVNSILENTQSIAFALNSAFDYSKIAINDFKIVNNTYSLSRIIRNVERVVRCDVQKNNVYFDSYIDGNENLKIYGDQRKIEEIIINLVKIAAHHTIQGGIELKTLYADLTVDRVNIMLIIEDSGVGMTDNELSDYAEELNDVPLSLEVGDTGLGINMVKQLVKILNGKIVVDSTKNVGTIYTVMIPQKIVTSDDSKWENEKIRSSIELMNEFSYIKDEKKIALYTTQIERKETTGVERREIKKNEIDYNQESSSFNLDIFEEKHNSVDDMREEFNQNLSNNTVAESFNENTNNNTVDESFYENTNNNTVDESFNENVNNNIVEESYSENVGDSIVNEVDNYGVSKNIDNNMNDIKNGMEYKNNNIEYIPESAVENEIRNENELENGMKLVNEMNGKDEEKNDNMVKVDEDRSESEEDDETIYDIPLPKNQEEFLTRQNQYNSSKDLEQNKFENDKHNEEQEEFEMETGNNEEIEEFEIETDNNEEQEELEMESEDNEEQEEFEIETDNNEEQVEFEIESEDNAEQALELEHNKNIDYINSFLAEYGVDGAEILKEYDNNLESYKKALINFYEYSKDGANRIIGLWNSKNIKEYFSALDVVKEGALGIGACKFANIIQAQLERGAQGDLKYVAQTVKDVFAEWKMLLNGIVQFIQNSK